MNWTVSDFERYVTNKWMLAGNESLWDGSVSQLDTLYGMVRKIDCSTGYKDGQEERIMILQIGDKFFKKFGSYDSWDSADWEGRLIQVKPVEKTVTVYEAV